MNFYNSLTDGIEPFEPLVPGKVGIYSCGPTVYDYAHIGNWRANVFADLLRRYLEYRGFEVVHVMNITDVDDKTIKGAREAGVSLSDYTAGYTEAFFEDRDALHLRPAHIYPRATEHIEQMVELLTEMGENGLTYESEGSIYYAVDRFPEYGRLSGVNLEGLQVGKRVDSDEYDKESPGDFVVWKARKPDDGDVFWPTSFGEGRPGWHLECSAMSAHYLGNPFDIHTGGIDLQFPHHENEIAQTWGATNRPLARYWLHNEYLIVDGRKMSKSLGNFYTLRDLVEEGIDPLTVRYLLMSTHYRQQLNFRREGLDSAATSLTRIREAARLWQERADRSEGEGILSGQAEEVTRNAKESFIDAMDADLNISEGLAAVFELVRKGNHLLEKGMGSEGAKQLLEVLNEFDTVLVLLEVPDEGEGELPEDIQTLIDTREAARTRADWEEADRLRNQLKEAGFHIEDTPDGPRWKRVK